MRYLFHWGLKSYFHTFEFLKVLEKSKEIVLDEKWALIITWQLGRQTESLNWTLY